MFQKESPKSSTRKTDRETLIIPHKNITIKTFFNQKISNHEHKLTYVHCSNTSFRNQSNFAQNRYKATSFNLKSKYTNQSFVSGLSPKDKASNFFKYSSNSVRFVGRMRRRSLFSTATVKSQINRQSDQSHSLSGNLNRNKLLDHSGIEQIRKQLQLKFNRTRIILKEQQKMQKYQKIQKIYQNKYRPKAKQRLSRAESRESRSFCSPWNRTKVEGFDTINEAEPKFINISE